MPDANTNATADAVNAVHDVLDSEVHTRSTIPSTEDGGPDLIALSGAIVDAILEKYDLAPKRRRYDIVRRADKGVEVGDLVRSTYGTSGAVWRVEKVTQPTGYMRYPYVDLVSLASGRKDGRRANQLDVVREASE